MHTTKFKLLSTFIFVFFTFSITVFSQAEMTLWKIDEEHSGGHHHHDDDQDASVLFACGSEYYHARSSEDPEITSFWSIKNEGDQVLTISLPLVLTGATDRFMIVQQPTQSSLAPGEETIFSISYGGPSNNNTASLIINSNSATSPNCELILDGGGSACGNLIVWTGGGDGTTWEDGTNWSPAGVPTAADEVDISITSTITLSSNATIMRLFMDNMSNLTINAGNTLTITSSTCTVEAIDMFGNSQITNNGIILMNLTPGDYDDGIEMDEDAAITNNGSITINGAGDDGIEMDGNATFTNNGSLAINENGSDGIDMDGNVTFTNNGDLTINGPGTDAIEIDSRTGGASTFINTGTITITNPTNEGIEIDDGATEFTNSGTIIIIGVDGTDEPLPVEGIFTNTGVINITGTLLDAGEAAIEVRSDGTLLNGLCAIINIEDGIIEVQTSATLTNEGIIATNTATGNINDGVFTNTGQIITPPGTFMISPNAIVGSGVIIAGAVPVTRSLCVESVPTMGEWGLIILSLLILSMGAVLLFRRKEEKDTEVVVTSNTK